MADTVHTDPPGPAPERDDKSTFALRDAWFERAKAREMTLETLPAFLQELAGFGHDYNTIVYAVAAAAVAAGTALNRTPNGGITGFQAGAVMWEFRGLWLHKPRDEPAWYCEGSDLLYPQYSYRFRAISPRVWEWLQKRAGELMTEAGDAHPDVVAHWRSILAGTVPFGLTVEDR